MKVTIEVEVNEDREPARADLLPITHALDRAIAREYNLVEVARLRVARDIVEGVAVQLPDNPTQAG